MVWFSVGPKGELSKGTFSGDEAKKDAYSYPVETVFPDGSRKTQIKYVVWTGNDEKLEWFEPTNTRVSPLLERQIIRYKRLE